MHPSLDDYQNGFLGGQGEGAAELLKAMQAGQITGRDTTNLSLTQEPLKAESLEKTLKLLEFRQKDIKLLNKMPKMTAYNTVEEFLQLDSYGSARGGFYNEGELSDVEDSKYIRRSELIKYIQITGEVTMQAQMVRSYVDAMRKEVENKVMWVTRAANTAITSGDSNLIPQEWNGLYKQHASIGTGALYADIEAYYNSTVVIDMRGKSVKQLDVEKGAVRIDANYGNVSDFFAPTTVISTISQDYFASQRIMLNANSPMAYEGQFGSVAKSIATTIGDVALNADKFMKKAFSDGRLLSDSATSGKAPSAPTAGTAPALVADTTCKYAAGETGTVYYAVSSINRFGESAMTLLAASAVTITVGSAVDLTFTGAASIIPGTAYQVYRTKVTSAGTATNEKFYPLFKVSAAELTAGYDGGAAGKVRDRGRFLPDTEEAFLTEMVDDVMSFKQLAPISKLDLAVLAMSRRFITFLFATPQLYTPKKMVRYINCAKTLTA
jgi:hypothetical protein